jgi:uncharacterized protein (TIGR00297 family)
MTRSPQFSEDVRQLVHISVGCCAVLLRFLAWWEAAVLAGAALAFNLYALPRIAGPRLYRQDEATSRYGSGITLYPLVILLLILVFPDRRDIVAAAWGVLAAGDGMATLVGRRVASPPIPWNSDKSIAGSAAFVIFGGAAGAWLCWWCRPVIVPPAYLWFSVGMPFLAAAAAAAVETIPIRLNDNLSVPATAAAVLWWSSLFNEDLLAELFGPGAGRLVLLAAANVAVAAAGYAARTVTMPGAICGALLGTTILLTTGWGGWCLLLATFGLAVITSRLGLARKTQLGIAEERGGRRGAGNAFANTGVAAAAAVLAATSYAAGPARLACVAALAAGGSDTIASEIGKAWGRRTYLVPTLRRVAAGTSGAMSIEGTAAGLLGAVVLGAIGIAAGLVPARMLLPIVAAATIGAFAESLLGATLEHRGFLNNDVLNFLNTAIAAAAAIFIAGLLK